MAALTKFQPFVEKLAEKKHDFSADTLMIALTNTVPTVGMAALSEITQISYANCSSRTVTTTSSGQTAGVYKLVLVDVTLTASGAVGPFQWIVLYNSSAAAGHELIGFAAYASAVTLANAEQFVIDFDQAGGAITLE